MAAGMKHMVANFSKLDKFERMDFRRWQKKMHFLLYTMSMVYVLTTPIPEDGENATVEQIRKRSKWENDDYVCRGIILNGMSDFLFDIYQNVESEKELWNSLEAKYMAEYASSKKFLDSDKPIGKNVVGPSVVNMAEHNNSSKYTNNRGKRKHQADTKADPSKKSKLTLSTPMDTSEKLMPNNGKACSALASSLTSTEYSKKTMDYCLSYTGYHSVLEGYTDASWISNTEDSSSISGWVFLLRGGAISWVSKKQTCIKSSTMKSEFVALASASKEAEWLRNAIFEIILWSKPIALISIHCDSATTLEKAYSQMYNGKSRHLGVRHSMIRELH
ncbi:hypothetical protein Tco_1123696 [Tanacetum coccineum]|uniref:Zinc finger, CCHC-type n=1 Tax=Tanacetum coccineum TaxID=301880 RepID=A0ABQ5J569_9ASTR